MPLHIVQIKMGHQKPIVTKEIVKGVLRKKNLQGKRRRLLIQPGPNQADTLSWIIVSAFDSSLLALDLRESQFLNGVQTG